MRLDELDRFNDLALRIKKLPRLIQPGDLTRVCSAVDGLRGLPFPPGYLDEVRTEMLKTLQGDRPAKASVYLAFYGMGEFASHLKIGIAKSVRNRLSGLRTGNPMPMLWAFSAQMESREDAAEAERGLLNHLSDLKVHGEWVQVSGLSLAASEAIVESLAEVASACVAGEVVFTRFPG